MKNINFYQKNCFSFYTEFVSKKKDLELKSRLLTIERLIGQNYLQYEVSFANNTLETLNINSFTGQNHQDLLSLYSYRNKMILDLKISLTTTESNRISNTCPYCTIGEINSMDHYLPKSSYSQHSVNPKNLIPCCPTCNSLKNERWLQHNDRIFLNVYLDLLPSVQYLFVEIKFEDGIFVPYFTIDNPNNIEERLFSRIKSHYNSLKLCQRFQDNCYEAISVLTNNLKEFITTVGIEKSTEIVINTANENRKLFGYNYWKSILEIEMVRNTSFISAFSINPVT